MSNTPQRFAEAIAGNFTGCDNTKVMHGYASVDPGFLAGYGYAMSQAHQQALEHVKNVGALSMRVKQTEQEQLRTLNRMRGVELVMALGTGQLMQNLKALEGRVGAAEEDRMQERLQLEVMSHRLRECEHRVSEGVLHTLLRRVAGVVVSTVRAILSSNTLEVSTQQRMLLAVAGAWAAVEVLLSFGMLRHVVRVHTAWVRAARVSARLCALLFLYRSLARTAHTLFQPPPSPPLPSPRARAAMG
mmetsp:Transcript_66815/g.139246  ORF Transcript_66815/g.139246 Transcript_66815/m.139246 type:complete len:245 (+) Transcript_66815:74-808(+)|eukprot:CAMPEP_0181343464 /NCGR_PEP_ID=MMETSP1101-20121128/31601_1 /TAXON_ID=46948 /ORGANISM="Rhodomonas abbreviata, Strain Caron Lab Isolate" /LENGTH=244 /DNA_ID=CAMNT_0023455097 /DNA_START=139 /DNA_END=873 /DNA_ORIENTATION=+